MDCRLGLRILERGALCVFLDKAKLGMCLALMEVDFNRGLRA
jgi:hypothetical protein